MAELLSLARQLSWGEDKVRELNHYLAKNLILDIKGTDKELMAAYAEIDAYSQGKLKDKPLHGSAKNMGKNDLWIAATAKVAKAKLITTDNDFHHLNGTMIDVLTYKPN